MTHPARIGRVVSRKSMLQARFSSSFTTDIDAKLRTDVKLLGKSLGTVMNNKDQDLFESVEKLRLLGKFILILIMLEK